MTHKEKYIDFLKSIGLSQTFDSKLEISSAYYISIQINVDEVYTYGGYSGFCNRFVFDKNGNYVNHGSYE